MEGLDTIKLILSIAGVVISMLLAVVGFFLARIVSDVKSNTMSIGKNIGAIKLVGQKQESDVERIEKTTQLELQQLSKNVGGLAESVNTLVTIQMQKGKD